MGGLVGGEEASSKPFLLLETGLPYDYDSDLEVAGLRAQTPGVIGAAVVAANAGAVDMSQLPDMGQLPAMSQPSAVMASAGLS